MSGETWWVEYRRKHSRTWHIKGITFGKAQAQAWANDLRLETDDEGRPLYVRIVKGGN